MHGETVKFRKFILSNVIFVLVVSLRQLNKVDCNADCFNKNEHS